MEADNKGRFVTDRHGDIMEAGIRIIDLLVEYNFTREEYRYVLTTLIETEKILDIDTGNLEDT